MLNVLKCIYQISPFFNLSSTFFPIRHKRLAGDENSTFSGVLLFLLKVPEPTLQCDQLSVTGDDYIFKHCHEASDFHILY